MIKQLYQTCFVLLLSILFQGCTEQYALQSNTFEEALVVEATITNELKQQEIKISKTYRLETSGPTFESGAIVFVTDDLGNQYNFNEVNGVYVSENPFQATPERTYKLNITTESGRSYTSTAEKLTTVNEIESVIPAVVVRNGERGVEMSVNSFDPTFKSKYYRYEYEETYKVIAPKWNRNEAIVLGEQEIGTQLITTETKTCYGTQKSDTVLLNNTTGLAEDRDTFPVRFISDQNYIISHRYSILVRRYVESLSAYTFYKTLQKLSGNGSLLSQNQPGFFYGNLKSITNPNEKIIGFFEVASVSSKRIFFNYADLFPQEPLPPYYTKCTEEVLYFCFSLPPCVGDGIISAINDHTLTYYYNDGIIYHMYPAPCGDCTTFASNVIPPFWIN